MRHAARVLLGLLLVSPALGAGRPMTVDDLLAVKSVADPQVSPDGKRVVYVVGEIDRPSGKTNTDLWMIDLNGGDPQRLTTAPGTDTQPRWSPDGKQISFVSDRGGSAQVWLLPVEGGEARQLTKLPIDVTGPIWSPKGDKLAFVAEVYPGKSPEETAAKDKEHAASKSKVRIFDHLLIRHWTAWDEGKCSHLFVCDARTGEAKDLTPKLDVNTPPAPFGGSNDYTFAPDGKQLAFTAEPLKDAAWSTNTDIWTVSVDGGELKNLTKDNVAADAQPAYSPDGKKLAYLSQARPGFESDLWVLKVRDLEKGEVNNRISNWLDKPVQSFAWSSNSESVWAVVDSNGSQAIFELPTTKADGKVKVGIGTKGSRSAIQPAPDNKSVVFVQTNCNHPPELFRAASASWEPVALTQHNRALTAALDLTPAESLVFEGADGDKVTGWLIRPPGFDASKKYPVVFLIHGGPQGAFHDEWHNRWNYGLFAAPGYAVVAINPRGSTGFGQKFTDQISKDWTGRVYEDLMKGLDHALQTYPFLDKNHVAAAGGSYGGFMVNWIAGHSDRFQCLISHAGVFDLTSKYGTTEELWFPEWEFGGTPWEQPQIYREQSPSSFVQNFKTPTLIIHGALDFRVPDAQGLGMFTALQRQGVPSRFVFFPDEGHWILKPANRVVWWNEVHEWLEKYLKKTTENP
ncbi:MAG TPA: S9 family peptidase [Isosphaeraceae bacterium]|jgi:dipeptidyl aminopeptidase/acylaminoacyl peptidase|nr:S9 family peptidase [Isosphaeraceae bacterium]